MTFGLRRHGSRNPMLGSSTEDAPMTTDAKTTARITTPETGTSDWGFLLKDMAIKKQSATQAHTASAAAIYEPPDEGGRYRISTFTFRSSVQDNRRHKLLGVQHCQAHTKKRRPDRSFCQTLPRKSA